MGKKAQKEATLKLIEAYEVENAVLLSASEETLAVANLLADHKAEIRRRAKMLTPLKIRKRPNLGDYTEAARDTAQRLAEQADWEDAARIVLGLKG